MVRLVVSVSGVLAMVPLTAAYAQTDVLTPGAMVRIEAPGVLPGRYEAVIGARRGDTLSLVRRDVPPRELVLSAATRIDFSRGRTRRTGAWHGLLWGAGIGAAIGLLNTTGHGQNATGGCRTITCGSSALGDGGAFLVAGVLYGAGIGALVRAESWRTVVPRPVSAQR